MPELLLELARLWRIFMAIAGEPTNLDGDATPRTSSIAGKAGALADRLALVDPDEVQVVVGDLRRRGLAVERPRRGSP